MPLTIGQALDRAEISSDDTTGNLEELKSTLLEFEYSPGDQTEDYTAVGDDTVNNEGIKPNPYIRARFKPESDDDESIAIVIAGGGKRAFDFQVVADSTNNRGIRIHGTGRLVRGRWLHTGAGRSDYECRIVSAGNNFTISRTTT